jgi:hypothetical protein
MATNFKSKRTAGIGTTLTSVGSYTVPASTQTTVIGLTLCNTTSNTVTASVSYYDGTSDTYLVRNAYVAVGGTLIVAGGDQKLVMETGSSIRVQSSTATSLDAILSILEIS